MSPTTFLGGALIGLGGSLHCAGMCGGISSALVIGMSARNDLKSRIGTLASAQVGKAAAYVATGAVLGGAGAGIYGMLDRHVAHLVLQWMGAGALIWIGLSMLGLVPAAAGLARIVSPLQQWARASRRRGGSTAIIAGMAWGLMPCNMVYSALMFAMLSGSSFGGALTMLGFALGTAPSVTAATLGVTQLQRISGTSGARHLVGGALIALGCATFIWPATALGICKF